MGVLHFDAQLAWNEDDVSLQSNTGIKVVLSRARARNHENALIGTTEENLGKTLFFFSFRL